MQDTTEKAGAYPVDYSKVALAEGDPLADLWLSGYVRGHRDYYFSAKVYGRTGEFGIDNSRVSKLTVWHRDQQVMSYDRGWDTRPSEPEHSEALNKILAAFPQPTKQQYRDFKRLQRDRCVDPDEPKPDPRRASRKATQLRDSDFERDR